MNKPRLYVLVGVPASGKSTWVKNQRWAAECAYVSTDYHVDAYAATQGKTYSEVFTEFMPQAIELMMQDVNEAKSKSQDIIWDQTSTTVKTRRRKLNPLRDYYKIAVVFKTPPQDELARRLNSRPGKIIPEQVMKQMIANLVEPTIDEGFDEIWYAE